MFSQTLAQKFNVIETEEEGDKRRVKVKKKHSWRAGKNIKQRPNCSSWPDFRKIVMLRNGAVCTKESR